jgi:hypothetical protein
MVAIVNCNGSIKVKVCMDAARLMTMTLLGAKLLSVVQLQQAALRVKHGMFVSCQVW